MKRKAKDCTPNSFTSALCTRISPAWHCQPSVNFHDQLGNSRYNILIINKRHLETSCPIRENSYSETLQMGQNVGLNDTVNIHADWKTSLDPGLPSLDFCGCVSLLASVPSLLFLLLPLPCPHDLVAAAAVAFRLQGQVLKLEEA